MRVRNNPVTYISKNTLINLGSNKAFMKVKAFIKHHSRLEIIWG